MATKLRSLAAPAWRVARALGFASSGKDLWRGACPLCSKSGKGTSAVVNTLRDGRAGMWCYECKQIPTRGIAKRNFFSNHIEPKMWSGVSERPPAPQPARKVRTMRLPAIGGGLGAIAEVTHLYRYLYPDGSDSGLVVVRGRDRKSGGKTFRQLSATEKGWYKWGAEKGRKYPPYGSHLINDTTTHLLIVEGEKCADYANDYFTCFPLREADPPMNLVAVSCLGGAQGVAARTDWQVLADVIPRLTVVIWEDDDRGAKEFGGDDPGVVFRKACYAHFQGDLAPRAIGHVPRMYRGDLDKYDIADAIERKDDVGRIVREVQVAPPKYVPPAAKTTTKRPAKPAAKQEGKVETTGREHLLDKSPDSIGEFLSSRGIQFRRNERSDEAQVRIPTGMQYARAGKQVLLTESHSGYWCSVNDESLAVLATYLEAEADVWVRRQNAYLPVDLSVRALRDRVIAYCSKTSADPIREWMEGCRGKWDGEERLSTIVSTIWPDYDTDGRQQLNEFGDEIMRLCFLAMVGLTCGFRSVFHLSPVLIGDRGIGKSWFTQYLLPPDIESDNAKIAHYRKDELYRSTGHIQLRMDLEDREYALLTKQAVIAEVGEMVGVTASRFAEIKDRLTRPKTDYRPLYATGYEAAWNRVVIFFTSNELKFLPHMEKLDRRFYPIVLPHYHLQSEKTAVVSRMHDWMDRHRDQLVAEAISYFDAHAGLTTDLVPSDRCMAYYASIREDFVYKDESSAEYLAMVFKNLAWGMEDPDTAGNDWLTSLCKRLKARARYETVVDSLGNPAIGPDGAPIQRLCGFVSRTELCRLAGMEPTPQWRAARAALFRHMRREDVMESTRGTDGTSKRERGSLIPIDDLATRDELVRDGYTCPLAPALAQALHGGVDYDSERGDLAPAETTDGDDYYPKDEE